MNTAWCANTKLLGTGSLYEKEIKLNSKLSTVTVIKMYIVIPNFDHTSRYIPFPMVSTFKSPFFFWLKTPSLFKCQPFPSKAIEEGRQRVFFHSSIFICRCKVIGDAYLEVDLRDGFLCCMCMNFERSKCADYKMFWNKP